MTGVATATPSTRGWALGLHKGLVGRQARRLATATTFATTVAMTATLLGAPTASAATTWLPQVDATAGHTHAEGAVVALDGTGRVTVATVTYDYDGTDFTTRVVVATREPGAAAYGPEQELTDDDATSPSIGSNRAGLTAVAFEDRAMGDIQVALRAPGDALFQAPVTVSGDDTRVATGSQVIVSPAGAVTVLWTSHDWDANTTSVQFATRAAGSSTWSAATDLATPVAGVIYDLAAGVDAAGVITAAWGLAHHVWAATSKPAGGWGDPVDLTPTMSAGDPKLAVGEDGTVAVGWLGGAYPDLKPWLAVRKPGREFVATAVEEAASGSSSAPDPAVSADGAVAAAWTYIKEPGRALIRTTAAVKGQEPETAATLSAPPTDPVLGSGPDGALTVVWAQPAVTGSSVVGAVHRPAGSGWSAPVPVTPDVRDAVEQDPVVAVDRFGDATVAFRDYDRALPANHEERTGTVTLDVSGPRIAWAASGPGTAGAVLGLSVATTDWSAPVSVAWSFGDGASGSGASTTHTYAAAGSYPVTVTATDASGNRSTSTRQVTVSAAPAAGDRTAPALTGAKLTPRRLPTGQGARLRVTSTEAGRLTGMVQRRKDGRWKAAGSKHWAVRAGANERTFYGKTAEQRLRTGRYRVVLTAADAAGNVSTATALRFRVDRG